MSNLTPLPEQGSTAWYAWAQSIHAALTTALGEYGTAPVAAFSASPVTGAPGVSVQFTSTSTGDPTSYVWDFGDGQRSIQQNPSHVYATAGKFAVTLTVSSPYGQDTRVRTDFINVTVPATPGVTITATPGNGFVTMTWTAFAGATAYKVGRDGTDTDGSGPWQETVTGTTWSALKLVNGTAYNLYVIPQVNGADGPTSTVTSTPTAGSTTTTPIGGGSTSGRKVPLIGRSGLPWNSTVFTGAATVYTAFETWRNRPVDGVLSFPYRLQDWLNMSSLPARRSGDLMVWSVPPFLQGAGITNQRVANGEFDSQWVTFAQRLIAGGWNNSRTAIRLGWENNGNWYEWSQSNGGTAAWIAAFRRVVTICRNAGLTQVVWNWCLSKGPQAYNNGVSWQSGYPGDDVVDVIGIDSYDYYSPSFNETQWQAEVAGSGTFGKNPGLDQVKAFAVARGKLMSLDEWGVANGTGGGQDNPWYVGRTFDWCKANASILAWENTYDHPGNPGLNHILSDGSNPLAAARYRQSYPNGWGG